MTIIHPGRPNAGASARPKSLTETQRLRLRTTLLANPDLELDAAASTAIAYVLAPVVAEMLDEERRAAPRTAATGPGISGW